MMCCKTNHKELPILSYTIDTNGTKQYHNITYNNFKNQFNQPFSTSNIEGKVFIANFFFTKCPSICPPMRTQLITIADTFKDRINFLIVSHTIDPKNDSVTVLKNYADAAGISENTWQFLRAETDITKQQAKQYMTNFKPNEDGTDFYHSSYVALVDKEQQIRGFYNILVKEDVERLQHDIEILLK